MNLPNKNYLHAAALLKSLSARGVKRAVISPGSRSTPLAAAAVTSGWFDCAVLPDERAAAYYALGLSKADGAPALLMCTSGTATANYFPAVVEAAQSCVPLLIVTADRPARLRHRGAAQTIDQTRLYGDYARSFAEVPEAELTADHLDRVQSLAQAAFTAAMTEPRGVAHLNVPLDEPLEPAPVDSELCAQLWRQWSGSASFASGTAIHSTPDGSVLAELADELGASLCGLIVAGPNAARDSREAEAIYRLSRALGWPLLADVTSGLRFLASPVFPYYDIYLREENQAALSPDVVLAFGAHPTSKVLNTYLNRHRAASTTRIQPHNLVQDPDSRASRTIIGGIVGICDALMERVRASRDSLLYEGFRMASAEIGAALQTRPLLDGEMCEAAFVRGAVQSLPEGANLVLANSMAVRYADALGAGPGTAPRVFALRGANGIDGTISHAAGIAKASGAPTLLVIGDLAFLHDMNGLLAARSTPNLTMLLLNNDGGGIFHMLPVSKTEPAELFETIHGTPQGLHLSAAAELFGIEWNVVTNPAAMNALRYSGTVARVMEVRMSRAQNAAAYRKWIKRLSAEARGS